MSLSKSKNELVAYRLTEILRRLNNGEELNSNKLAKEFNVSHRTIQKDLNERFSFLEWAQSNKRGIYKLNRSQLGLFSETEIKRFANFASIQNLFPELDRRYFQEYLTQGMKVKGFYYENIKHKQNDFLLLQQAIKEQKEILFYYTKLGELEGKNYQLKPYQLLNKNGIWYLIGSSEEKIKTFCFSQIKTLVIQDKNFNLDENITQEIEKNESIYYGNHTNKVLIKVSKTAAPYFLRRNLFPNQELIENLEDDGGILLKCSNVNSMEIIPVVQFWIPHITIISPEEWQTQINKNLRNYLTIL